MISRWNICSVTIVLRLVAIHNSDCLVMHSVLFNLVLKNLKKLIEKKTKD